MLTALPSPIFQGQLAQMAGVARETVSRIEKGTYNDLGIKKVATLLDLVGAQLTVPTREKPRVPDLRLAHGEHSEPQPAGSPTR